MVAWTVVIASAFYVGWDPRWTLFRVQLPPLAVAVGILATAGVLGAVKQFIGQVACSAARVVGA